MFETVLLLPKTFELQLPEIEHLESVDDVWSDFSKVWCVKIGKGMLVIVSVVDQRSCSVTC